MSHNYTYMVQFIIYHSNLKQLDSVNDEIIHKYFGGTCDSIEYIYEET